MNGWHGNLYNCHHLRLGQIIVCSSMPSVDRALIKSLRREDSCHRFLQDGRAECDVPSWVVDGTGSACRSYRLRLWDVDGGDGGRREPGRDPGEESVSKLGLEGFGLVVELVVGPVDGHVGLVGARGLVVPTLPALAGLVDQVVGTVHDEEGDLELRGKSVRRRSSLQDLAGESGAQVAVVHQGVGLVSRVESLVVRELVHLCRVPVVHFGRRRLQALALQLRCHGLGLGGKAGGEQDQAADHEVAKVWAHGGVDGDERAHTVAEDEAGHACRCGARLGNVADEVRQVVDVVCEEIGVAALSRAFAVPVVVDCKAVESLGVEKHGEPLVTPAVPGSTCAESDITLCRCLSPPMVPSNCALLQ